MKIKIQLLQEKCQSRKISAYIKKEAFPPELDTSTHALSLNLREFIWHDVNYF